MGELDTLLVVQEHDTAIARLEYQIDTLPERAELSDLEKQMADLDATIAELKSRRHDTSVSQKKDEADSAGLADRVASIDKQMYSGTITATRDLQAMSHEIDSLKARRSEIDDRVMEAMEAIEASDAELGNLAEQRTSLESASSGVREKIGQATAEAKGLIAVQRTERDAAAAGLSGELLERYAHLARHNGGVGAAKLVGGACSGCHLSLPAAELDKIRRAPDGSVSMCEQCGRILVP